MASLTLRLPDDLHATVKEHANADERSLNKELVVLLREAVTAREAAKAREQAEG
ncbi:Arc family DNA-binding protein [Kribbella sp. NPDC048928]|uniref:Arc family DNA-binding protein n=1 Tax=Kribbella sp. NPDC048928 TaxID=3364111 RepID=UPI003719B043